MATAITRIEKQIPTEAHQQAESMQEILKVLSENKQSFIAFLDVLKEAEKSGLFDIIQGILKNKTDVAKVGMEFIQVAGVPTMMKNGIIAIQFLSKLDPLKVHMLLNGLNQGLEKATTQDNNRTSIWGMAKAVREPEINSTITVLLNFLRGMGTEFNKSNEQVKRELHEKPST